MSYNEAMKQDILRLTNQVESLTYTVESLVDIIKKQPEFLPISTLVSHTKKTRQTIRNHLINNYEPEVDFKIQNGKILIASKVFVAIREYYDNKNK